MAHDPVVDELRLIRLPAVLEIVPVSKATLFRMMAREEFPKPRKIGGSSAWRYSKVKKWVEDLEDEDVSPASSRDDSDII